MQPQNKKIILAAEYRKSHKAMLANIIFKEGQPQTQLDHYQQELMKPCDEHNIACEGATPFKTLLMGGSISILTQESLSLYALSREMAQGA